MCKCTLADLSISHSNDALNIRGSYFCHSCQRRIIFERYQCVTCMDEDLSSQIDLCAECIQTPNLASESHFAHDVSHSLIRSTHRIHECELASMIPQARLRSERIKSSFRAAEAKDTAPNATVNTDQKTRAAPVVDPFQCACCSEKITLPCWICVSCGAFYVVKVDLSDYLPVSPRHVYLPRL
jgi:hypothetical protein